MHGARIPHTTASRRLRTTESTTGATELQRLNGGWSCEGSSQLMYATYHDRYQRTSERWKFAERVYEVRYLDTPPLAGNGPVRHERSLGCARRD